MFFQSQWLKTSENPKILQFLSTFNFLLSDMNKWNIKLINKYANPQHWVLHW